MAEDRLQKILARAGIASRRKAEDLIREGHVTVNGKTAEVGDKADPARDTIKVEGKRIQLPQEHRYLLLNKPRGVMSTVSDPEGRPTVLDFVPPAFRKALVPVGRLDFNTEGLLLLTDDGEFAQRISHPRYGSKKTYEVKVKGRPAEDEIERLRAGIVLDGKRTAPARIVPLPSKAPTGRRQGTRGEEGDNTWWQVELSEGRTRQIREMFERVGHPVQKLRRVAIGSLRDPHLPIGALRELTELEVAKLLKGGGAAPQKPASPRKKAAAPVVRHAAKKPASAKKAAPAAAATTGRARPAKPAAPAGAKKAVKKAAAPARKAAKKPAGKPAAAKKAAPRKASRPGSPGRKPQTPRTRDRR